LIAVAPVHRGRFFPSQQGKILDIAHFFEKLADIVHCKENTGYDIGGTYEDLL
jgi:hypothetical protein